MPRLFSSAAGTSNLPLPMRLYISPMRPNPQANETRDAPRQLAILIFPAAICLFTYLEDAVARLPQSLGCCIQCGSASRSVMEYRSAPILPTYAESCAHDNCPKKDSLCQTLFPYKTLREPDPVIILITLAVVIGSFCLLSGFILLCVVSKAWQDETSEAILLMGIGFFITSLSCVTWKLTNAQRLAQLQETISI